MSQTTSSILDRHGEPYKRSRLTAGGVGGKAIGGIVNPGSGMGTALDKSQGSFFTPTRIYWRSPMEILSRMKVAGSTPASRSSHVQGLT